MSPQLHAENRDWFGVARLLVLGVLVVTVTGLWLGWPVPLFSNLPSHSEIPSPPPGEGAGEPDGSLSEVATAAHVSPRVSELAPQPVGWQPLQRHLQTRRTAGTELRGWVRSESGQALIGARATLYPADQEGSGRHELMPSVRTDQRGYFRMEIANPPGVVRLTIEHDTHVGLQDFPQLHPGSVMERTYQLETGRAELEGRVLSESRLPIPGAQVTVGRIRSFSAGRTESIFREPVTTDYRGRFHLDNLPAGEISLIFMADGYFVSATEVTLAAGKNPPVTHQLRQGARHSLRVVDPQGFPVHPALLRTEELRPYSSDRDGWIDFLLQPGANRVNAELSAPGYLARTIEIATASVQSEQVLQPGEPFSGVVLSAAGEPISNAQVVVSGAGHYYEASLLTDPDGGFQLALSRPPASSLFVTHPGYVETRLDLNGVVAPGFVEVRMKPPEAGLYGRLISSAGRPLELFTIHLTDAQGRRYSRHFRNSRGAFEILDLAPGTYRLEAASEEETLSRTGLVLTRGQVLGPLWLQLPDRSGGG